MNVVVFPTPLSAPFTSHRHPRKSCCVDSSFFYFFSLARLCEGVAHARDSLAHGVETWRAERGVNFSVFLNTRSARQTSKARRHAYLSRNQRLKSVRQTNAERANPLCAVHSRSL
jgi:hypothetical protein